MGQEEEVVMLHPVQQVRVVLQMEGGMQVEQQLDNLGLEQPVAPVVPQIQAEQSKH
jgi:hypothetical protein